MKHIKGSTYRLQVNPQFNFEQVIDILDYLQQLGISTLYLSPIMQANPTSTHGYDGINYQLINPELGGEKSFQKLVVELTKRNITLLVDFVPNHMAASRFNLWWQDVIEHGKTSSYHAYFDIQWKHAKKNQLVFRRFFDVNDLVCLRMEDETVFDDVHGYLFGLIEQKKIHGLRIDHIDGLRFPDKYIHRLRQHLGDDFYLIVEKILAYEEKIPSSWNIQGTTGYEFLNFVNQLYVYPPGFANLVKFYKRTTRNKKTIAEIKVEKNTLVLKKLFKREFTHLFKTLRNILKQLQIDYTDKSLRLILQAVSVWLPVYRTYFKNQELEQSSKKVLTKTFAKLNQVHDLDQDLLRQIEKILSLNFADDWAIDVKDACRHWVSDWQVFTGPLMAKGYEDTSCYVYNSLVSLNEVGSSPAFFNHVGEEEIFHHYNQFKQKHYPSSLNTSSTHDTKLSEDVRARINVLSEIDEEWQQHFRLWHVLNKTHKPVSSKQVPSVTDEFRLYQILLGAWPLISQEEKQFIERFKNYFVKVLREAKIYSSWQKPNTDYENTFTEFIQKILSPTNHDFLVSFALFQRKIAFFGMLNALSQTTLKLMSPGIPDFYQGNDLWRFDLVDPDNRRPVDFALRSTSLHNTSSLVEQQRAHAAYSVLLDWENGQVKMYLIHELLQLRSQFPDVFLYGEYIPINTTGNFAKHVVAFYRHYQNTAVLVVVPRWLTKITTLNQFPFAEAWENTQLILAKLPAVQWRNIFTDDIIVAQNNKLEVSQLLQQFPVCVCIADIEG